MSASFKICPLTGVNVNVPLETEKYYEYTLNIDGRNPLVRLSVTDSDFWNGEDKDEFRFLNFNLFYNDEWPAEEGTIITKKLVKQIYGRHQFPKLDGIEEKSDYFLEKIYKLGGRNLKQVEITQDQYPYAFVEDASTLRKLIYRLREAQLINCDFNLQSSNSNEPYKIDLLPEGERVAKMVIQKKRPVLDIPENDEQPKLCLISDEQDKYFHQQIIDLFNRSYAQSIDVSFGSNHSSNTHRIDSLRKDFEDPSVQIIFILSENSQKNVSFSGALNNARSIVGKKAALHRFHFFVVDDVDESKFNVVTDYYRNIGDFRYHPDKIKIHNSVIEAHRRVLAQNISENKSRQYKTYSFPIIEITELEKKWLEKIYDRFLKNEEFEIRHIVAKEWQLFSNFDPKTIPKILAEGGKEITLIGIWHIDQTLPIFEKFDQFMYAVQDRLRSGEDIQKLESIEIKPFLPDDISDEELFQITKLLRHFRGFTTGWGHNGPTGAFHITLGSDEPYTKFLNYNGLENLVRARFDEFEKVEKTRKSEFQNIKRDGDKIIFSDKLESDAFGHQRKQLLIHDPKDLNAVLNVNEIATETWSLIKDMPEEKGIFGIFGRWGRGKSFLIEKLIDRITEHNKTDSSKQYKTIIFDAWKYQDTPAVWGHLYESLTQTYLSKNKWRRLFALNYKKYGIWPILVTLGPAAISAILFLLPITFKLNVVFWLGIGGFLLVIAFYSKHIPKGKELFKKYLSIPNYKHLLGIQSEIQEEMIRLIELWIKDPKKLNLVLIIENLDRCNETKILPLIDALRVILEENSIAQRMKIIAAIDEELVTSCVKNKFKSFIVSEKTITNKEFLSEYLDKIFISGIRLNSLSSEDNGEIILALAEKDYRTEGISLDQIRNGSYKSEKNEDFTTTKTKDEKTEDLGSGSERVKYEQRVSIGGHTLSQNVIISNSKQEHESIKKPQRINTKTDQDSTIDEVTLIYECAKTHPGLTPRKLRIIYYRYFLAKNLFLVLYSSAETNVWRNKDYSKLLIELIFRFSKDKKGLDNLDLSKWNNEAPPIIPFPIKDVQIPYEDYVKMLSVLRMVIIF